MMNITKTGEQMFEKQVDQAGYKMYSEFLNFLHK